MPLSASQMRAVLSLRRRHHPLAVTAERRAYTVCWHGLSGRRSRCRSPHPRCARCCRTDAVTTRLPSPLNAALSTASVWPFRTAISLPLSASQMRAVLSSDAVTTRLPSPLNAALCTGRYGLSGRRSPCRSPHPRCARSCPQTPSPPACRRALNAALDTRAVWPFRTAISLPLSASQMRAVLSSRRRHHPLAIAAERRADTDWHGLSGRRSPCRSPHPRCARSCPQTPSPPACRRR